ncbi:MAG: hypothetical protein ACRD0D_12500 [Acidimicrobiales bacterium]
MSTGHGLYFDRHGQPIGLQEMARLWGDQAYRVVAEDWIGEVEVSTRWLGFDQSFRGAVPIIFETIVFGGRMDQYKRRYTTEDAAVSGHAQIVARVERALRPRP